MGVQDFQQKVQQLVNREQDGLIFALIERAKALGFRSTNIDLITACETNAGKLRSRCSSGELNPDRLSVFQLRAYAELVHMHKIKDADLPGAQQENWISLSRTSRSDFDAGYRFIDADHFARPRRRAGDRAVFFAYSRVTLLQGDSDLLGWAVSMHQHARRQLMRRIMKSKRYYDSI